MVTERKGGCRVPRHITKADIWRDAEQLRAAYHRAQAELRAVEASAVAAGFRFGTVPERVAGMAAQLDAQRTHTCPDPEPSWWGTLWRWVGA